jgi:hypothetical protein
MELNDNNKDRLDRWLDGALQQYGNTEPRTGLERRILTKLESAAQNRSRDRGWWWAWSTAAFMTCLAVAVWVGIDLHHATKRTVATANPANARASTKRSQSAPRQVATTVAHRARRRVSRPRIEVAQEPRLEQFPSARPLSEQEQLLARYVAELPQEAVMVANSQVERQKELEKLFADQSSKIESDQQER